MTGAAKGTPELFAEYREEQGGPAFIPSRAWFLPMTHQEREWIRAGAMVWRPATDWQIAGWHRVKVRDPEAYACPDCGSGRWTCRCYA